MNMNTSKTKNVLFIVLIAVVSSIVTLLGYNVANRNNISFLDKSGTNSTSEEIGLYSNSFNQDKNVVLTKIGRAHV